MSDRRDAVVDLLELEGALDALTDRLREFPWDCRKALAVLDGAAPRKAESLI